MLHTIGLIQAHGGSDGVGRDIGGIEDGDRLSASGETVVVVRPCCCAGGDGEGGDVWLDLAWNGDGDGGGEDPCLGVG